jgi:hypothetical protein
MQCKCASGQQPQSTAERETNIQWHTLNTLGYTKEILEDSEFHANSDKGTSLFSNVPPDYKNWRN